MKPCPPYELGECMSRYRRSLVAGGCYFFTVVSYRRQAILCDEAVRTALREAIEVVRVARSFEIDAWVLLPDHLHCIAFGHYPKAMRIFRRAR